MITRYDVLFENKSTVLIINLDFYYEFADFNYKEYAKDLRRKIEEIAKKHNAKRVKIIIGGVLVSTLILPSTNTISSNENKYITNTTIQDVLKINNYENALDNTFDIDEENIDINNNVEDKNNIITENNNINNKDNIIEQTNNFNENKQNSSINNNSTNTNEILDNNLNTIEDNKITNNNNLEKEEDNKITNNENLDETKKNEITNNNSYVTIHRSNGSIIYLELEEYLIGVVGSEMPASFNIEALKSQAIVARTYALKRISENKILTDTTSTQMYKDKEQLKEMWGNDFNKYYNKVKDAVMATSGIVLLYNNSYIDAVYHSTSNGKTEDAVYVWGNDIPYLKSVDSKTDINVSSYKRDTIFSYDKLSNILNTTITKDTNIYLERNLSGRVSNIKINDIEINGTLFRSLLGLRSTDFNIELKDNDVIITTYGYGHGVGMSQYGANGLANLGYTYEQILKHYYLNIILKKI